MQSQVLNVSANASIVQVSGKYMVVIPSNQANMYESFISESGIPTEPDCRLLGNYIFHIDGELHEGNYFFETLEAAINALKLYLTNLVDVIADNF